MGERFKLRMMLGGEHMGLLVSRNINLEMRQLHEVQQVPRNSVGALFTWGVCINSTQNTNSWPLSMSLLLQGLSLWDVLPSS